MRYLPFLLLAACGSSSTSNPSNTGPAVDAPAPAVATMDCGTVTDATTPADASTAYQCFVDAVDAKREGVTVRWNPVSDEGDLTFTTYRVVSAGIEVTIDDRNDSWAETPGIHVSTCASIHIEPTTTGGTVLYPEDCH